jgi:hypothetical protein
MATDLSTLAARLHSFVRAACLSRPSGFSGQGPGTISREPQRHATAEASAGTALAFAPAGIRSCDGFVARRSSSGAGHGSPTILHFSFGLGDERATDFVGTLQGSFLFNRQTSREEIKHANFSTCAEEVMSVLLPLHLPQLLPLVNIQQMWLMLPLGLQASVFIVVFLFCSDSQHVYY